MELKEGSALRKRRFLDPDRRLDRDRSKVNLELASRKLKKLWGQLILSRGLPVFGPHDVVSSGIAGGHSLEIQLHLEKTQRKRS